MKKLLAFLAGLWILCTPMEAAASLEKFSGEMQDFFVTLWKGSQRGQELYYDIVFVASPETEAYVEEMRNNPDIQKTVEEDALDPDVWWQWFEQLPMDHGMYMSKRTVLEWLENYMTISKEERGRLSYNLLFISQETMETYGGYDKKLN